MKIYQDGANDGKCGVRALQGQNVGGEKTEAPGGHYEVRRSSNRKVGSHGEILDWKILNFQRKRRAPQIGLTMEVSDWSDNGGI